MTRGFAVALALLLMGSAEGSDRALAETVNALDPTLEVQPQNTRGSADNVPMLERGELDIALVQGEAVYEALNGVGCPPADLRQVGLAR